MLTDLQRLIHATEKPTTRRAALRAAGCGFGMLSLAGLMAEAATTTNPSSPMAPPRPGVSTAALSHLLFPRSNPRTPSQ